MSCIFSVDVRMPWNVIGSMHYIFGMNKANEEAKFEELEPVNTRHDLAVSWSMGGVSTHRKEEFEDRKRTRTVCPCLMTQSVSWLKGILFIFLCEFWRISSINRPLRFMKKDFWMIWREPNKEKTQENMQFTET